MNEPSRRKRRELKRKEAKRLLLPRGGTTVVVGKGWKVAETEKEEVVCSLVFNPTIYIEPIPRYKLELLMEEYPHQEWLGYLVGSVSEKKNIFVEDLVIPPHEEVSSTSAEAVPFNIPDKCVGIIHSHHSMGAGRSGTDESYVDKNFLVSIIVATSANGLVFDAVNCQKTPCGKVITGKSTIKYVRPEPPFESESFIKEAKENIDKGKTEYLVPDYNLGLDNTAYNLSGYDTPLYRRSHLHRNIPLDRGRGKDIYVNRYGVVMLKTEADKLDRAGEELV